MKKVVIVSVLVLAAVFVFSAVGLAYAQTRTPDWDGDGPGWRGGRGGRGPGMMGGYGLNRGPMHPYMVEALAKALNLDPEAVQERIDKGETPWEIAASTGLTDDQVREILIKAHNAALDAAVADGVITQAQADWMKEHMQERWEYGFGPGAGPCHRGGGWNR